MTRKYGMLPHLCTFLFIVAFAQCSIYVGFPFPEQYPNVARVNQPFNFQMANITYKSTAGTVKYSASNLPEWLQFNGDSRTFTGIPTDKDVSDSVTITLNGEDSADGSTILQNYTLVVSADAGLELSSYDVVFTEIAQYGQTNGENGLVVKPGEQFDIKFDKQTFKLFPNSTRPIVAYYGRLSDRLSLPNWIKFNSDDLSFLGTVPYVTSDIAPSISYGFTFIATDYYNYAGAEGRFRLVVGAHQLSTSLNETIKVNGTLESDFNITVPIMSSVYQDGSLVSKANISTVYSNNLPSYVTLDSADFVLHGQFPDSSTFNNFTIVVRDNYGNEVDIPYQFDALGSTFTVSSLPSVNASRGEWFNYQLMDSLFTEGNKTNVTVNYQNADWLSFVKTNKTLQGSVPKNLGNVSVTVMANNEFDSDSKSFNLVGVDSKSALTSSTSSSATSTISSTSTPKSSPSASSTTAAPGKKSHSSNKKPLAIGLGVGIPCFVILCGLLLFFCCFRRRQNKEGEDENDKHVVPVKNLDYEKGVREPELDGPGFGITVDNDDHDEQAHQLAALNVLKLDEKKSDDGDARSTSSSLTHVESDHSVNNYYDASERPVKSWRAEDNKDDLVASVAAINRNSGGSMSTVNTENLFSVRLVDDGTKRESNQSSIGFTGANNRFFSDNSLNTILKRDDSGNIQRLDSDGNIVELLPQEAIALTTSKPRLPRSSSSNLENLVEETFRDNSQEQDQSTVYHSAADPNVTGQSLYTYTDGNTEHSFNLLSKFDNSASSSAANSDNQLHDKFYGSEHSPTDAFRAVHNSDGEIKWSEASDSTSTAHPDGANSFARASNDNAGHDHDTLHQASPVTHTFFTNNSLDSNDPIQRYSNSSLGKKAKLVDFTRKGSLRDTAKISHQHSEVSGEIAHIQNDDSD